MPVSSVLRDDGYYRLVEVSAEYSTSSQYPSVCQLMAQLSPDGVTFLQVNSFGGDQAIVRLHVEVREFATLVQVYQSYLAERETTDTPDTLSADLPDDLNEHPF